MTRGSGLLVAVVCGLTRELDVAQGYFRPACPLPTPEETGIGVSATREANKAAKCVLDEQAKRAR